MMICREAEAFDGTICIFVNGFEEWPVTITRTFPELNQVVFVHNEEPSEFFEDGNQVYLR